MIRVEGPASALSAEEAFGLALLIDLSRLLPCDDAHADVVRLRIVPRGAGSPVSTLADSSHHIAPRDGAVEVSRTLLSAVTAVAGGTAEQGSDARDRFGRVPSSANALVAAQIERSPLVSYAALRLRRATIAAAGLRVVRLVSAWPDGRRWAAAFTHDLDAVAWWPAFTGLRLVELVARKHPRHALRVVAAAIRSVAGNPLWTGVQQVLATESAHGVRGTWFVLCGSPTLATMRAGDLTYLPESRAARRIFDAVADGGHELGLHGSFATMCDADVFAAQRARLASLTAADVAGVRQHYLRIRPGTTELAMERAGFSYDATYGFPDRNGFRLGVADVVPRWIDRQQQSAALVEIPLTWMDRALSKYRGEENPSAWIEDALALADTCRAVGGLWVGLWHPNLTAAAGYPGAPEAYARLVASIVAARPYVAPMREMAAWRIARREARARHVAADGRTELDADEHWLEHLTAEPPSAEDVAASRLPSP